jgi:Zn-dependent metalloprotease
VSESCVDFPGEYSDFPSEIALDALGYEREFSCSSDNSNVGLLSKLMWCQNFRVCTHDYRMVTDEQLWLPKQHITNPPTPWDEVGVSAHANTLEVARFLQNELEHDGLDDNGLSYSSFVHYSGEYSNNAFWFPGHNIFVYGQFEQRNNESLEEVYYYSAGISIVAHEIFHGVTYFTSHLGSSYEQGALNESYSDIFGVLLTNREKLSIDDWEWEIGIPGGVGSESFPIRDLSNPSRFDQPEHMENYMTTPNDQGGVHINNGIHNKAAFNLLTSRDSENNYLFDVNSAGLLFYLALRSLRHYSTFLDSRVALTLVASNCFQDDGKYRTVIAAINKAFDDVGIQ